MTKADLIKRIAEDTGASKSNVEGILDALGKVATAELCKPDGEVPLPGLGKLKAKARKARVGRNPRTGNPVQIAAKTAVTFSAGKDLETALNS